MKTENAKKTDLPQKEQSYAETQMATAPAKIAKPNRHG